MRTGNTNEITVAPSLVDIDAANTYEALYNTDNTTLSNVFPSDVVSQPEVEAAIEYRNVFKQGDVITGFTKFYDVLTTSYLTQADFSLENILFWYQKLKLSNKEIFSYRGTSSFKQDNVLLQQLPGASLFMQNALNSSSQDNSRYFDIVSDSIGCIVNSKYVQLDSTLPLFDVNQEYYGVPIPYSASIENKMSASARNVAYDLSYKTTSLMRHNLLGVGYTNLTLQSNMQADASTSHGLNLINDLPTFVTINESLSILKDKLASIFSDAKTFSFIQYLSNIANDVAYNLRDIFPVTEEDKDFVVITSAERAQASQAIAAQEVELAKSQQILFEQKQGWDGADSVRYNPQIGLRPYPANSDNVTDSEIAAPLTGTGTSTGQEGAGTSLRASDVVGTDNVSIKSASVYGTQMNDDSTYFDTKPSDRDPEATRYWEKVYGGPEALARADKKYRESSRTAKSWGSLSNQEQYQGAYVGNKLTPGFDVGVSTSYGYPPRTLLRITDAVTGKPVTANGANPDGIYRVGDKGSTAALTDIKGAPAPALDFYSGNSTDMKKYFRSLTNSKTKLRVEVVKTRV
jgi:hypothetical protein